MLQEKADLEALDGTSPSTRALAHVRVLGDINLIRNNIRADCFNSSFVMSLWVMFMQI